jgi:anti-sigma factor RsiW
MKPNGPLSTCPAPETLSDFLLGRLPGAELQRVGEHLAHCNECLSRASTSMDDRLVADLRRSLRAPPTREEHDSEHCAAQAQSICADSDRESSSSPVPWPPPHPPKPSLWKWLKGKLGL